MREFAGEMAFKNGYTLGKNILTEAFAKQFIRGILKAIEEAGLEV